MNKTNTKTENKPIKILIAAMGGEGGGVLTKWLVTLAESRDYLVQYTFIPGVAQRTGSTVYYLELFPKAALPKNGAKPVMALMPCPGDVDLILATECIEAGRALQQGFITRERTDVIASTHRVYSVPEKMERADGRLDSDVILEALPRYAKSAVTFDMAEAAALTGSVINAVVFGALAASGVLPFPESAFETVIGDVASANRSGYELGYRMARGEEAASSAQAEKIQASPLVDQVARDYPLGAQEVIKAGVVKLTDYQDSAYAETYLRQMTAVLKIDQDNSGADRDYELTREVGKWLARLMAYDDVIRVADLKSKASRFDRVKREIKSGDEDLVEVTDYLKPRLEEMVSILPPGSANKVLKLFGQTKLAEKGFKLKINATHVSGFVVMRLLAKLKRFRRGSYREAIEMERIKSWMAEILRCGGSNYDLALEVAACARLVKGYGPTHCRGTENFAKVIGLSEEQKTPERVRQMREILLAEGPA